MRVKLATTLKSATCHGRPYYYGTSKFLWYCTSYSVPWPPVYLKSWPKVYISCYAFRICSTALIGKLEELYNCPLLLYIPWNLHSLADLPVVQPTSVLSSQVCTTHCNFLVAYDCCTWSSYWVKGLGTCFPTQPPVSTLHIAHLHMWQCTVQFT